MIDDRTRAEIMRDMAMVPTAHLHRAADRLYRAMLARVAVCLLVVAVVTFTGWWWLLVAVLVPVIASGLDWMLGRMVERELAERRAQRPLP